jgi:DNA repair exonuclease
MSAERALSDDAIERNGGTLIRFLHTADWQIGTQFGQFEPDEAAHLAQARFDTVRRIAEEAAARKVDAVLVAATYSTCRPSRTR